MSGKKREALTEAMQIAAVRAALAEGTSLESIENDHGKTLGAGIAAVRRESTTPPKSKGSGSVRRYASSI